MNMNSITSMLAERNISSITDSWPVASRRQTGQAAHLRILAWKKVRRSVELPREYHADSSHSKAGSYWFVSAAALHPFDEMLT